MDAVRAGVDYEQLLRNVLTRFGATTVTPDRPTAELDAMTSDIRASTPEGLEPKRTRPPSLGEIVAAQIQTATTEAILASRSVTAVEHGRLISLLAVNLYLANYVSGETDVAYRSYRQWLALRNIGGEPSILWNELFRWQWPAWRAHLRSARESEATYETICADGAHNDSVGWLVQRITEEAHLHGVRTDPNFVSWLRSADEAPHGFLRRAAAQRRFNSAVVLAQHASARTSKERLPRATWAALGPYPAAAWVGHWLNAVEGSPTSRVASIVARAYDTLPRVGPARPRGASKRPVSWPLYLDPYLS